MEGGAGGAAEQVTTDWGRPSTGTGSLLVLGPESTFKVSGAVLPLEALEEGPSLYLAGLGAPGSPGLWLHCPVSASVITWPPLPARVSLLSLSLF